MGPGKFVAKVGGAFVAGAPQHDDMTMVLVRVEELSQPGAPTIDGEFAELAGQR